MLKKLEKKRRVLELGFALGFALTVLLTAFAAHRRQVADRVCADTVRLHILANSDTLEDQLVKLQVRDAILAALPDSVLQADTTTGAEAALRQALSQESYRAMEPEVLGPAPAPVVKLNNRYRYRITVVGQNEKPLRQLLAAYMKAFARRPEHRNMAVHTDCNLMD